MKRFILFFILVLFVICSAFSKDLTKAQVSANSLREILDIVYYKNSRIGEEDSLCIKKDNTEFLLFYDTDTALLLFMTSWEKDKSISDARLLKILNQWDTDSIIACTYCEDSNIYMQYTLFFHDGVNSKNLNSTLKTLFQVANEFEDYLKKENAI